MEGWAEGTVGLVLLRIDDRLLHGQVVVGWGQRLGLRWYVVVDDDLASSSWEQGLYHDALPEGSEARFLGADEAVDSFSELPERREPGALITRGTPAMRRLAETGVLEGRTVTVGCIGSRSDRSRALSYVHLSTDEVDDLRRIRALGADVEARDMPSARSVPLDLLLDGLEDG